MAGIIFGIIGFYMLFSDLNGLIIYKTLIGFEVLFAITIIITIFAYYLPLKGIWKFIKISLDESNEEKIIINIKKRLNYPLWQLTGILGITLITSLFFIWKIS
jgi:hypothetical protein